MSGSSNMTWATFDGSHPTLHKPRKPSGRTLSLTPRLSLLTASLFLPSTIPDCLASCGFSIYIYLDLPSLSTHINPTSAIDSSSRTLETQKVVLSFLQRGNSQKGSVFPGGEEEEKRPSTILFSEEASNPSPDYHIAMARSLSNAKLLSAAVVDGISSAIKRYRLVHPAWCPRKQGGGKLCFPIKTKGTYCSATSFPSPPPFFLSLCSDLLSYDQTCHISHTFFSRHSHSLIGILRSITNFDHIGGVSPRRLPKELREQEAGAAP